MVTPKEKHMVTQIEGLAAQIGVLFPDETRFRVTRKLLEAAAWRLTYMGVPDGR